MTMTAPVGSSMMVNVVQLRNEGMTQFRMKYGPRDWLVIEPGASVFVTEEVAWQFVGRWWTDNSNPRRRERANEVLRLRVLYGAYEDEVAWATNRPALSAWTPDGQRITTVIDDPDGVEERHITTPLGREQSLERQMDMLQGMVLELQAKLEREQTRAANADQPPVPSDVVPPAPTAPGPPMAGPRSHTFPSGVSAPVAPAPVTDRPVGPPVESEVAITAAGVEEQAPERPPVVVETLYPDEAELAAGPGDVPVDTPNRARVGAARSSEA